MWNSWLDDEFPSIICTCDYCQSLFYIHKQQRLSNRVAFLFCAKGSETVANEWYRRMENRIIGSIDNEIKKQKRLEEQQKKRRGGDM